jgi:hypothetical protein
VGELWRSLRDVDGISVWNFEKEKVGIVLHVIHNGESNEEDEKATDEEDEDADVQNAASISEGRGLVGRIGSMMEVIFFIRTVLVVIY